MAFFAKSTVVVEDDGEPVTWRRSLLVRFVVPLLALAMLGLTAALAFDTPSPSLFLLVVAYVAVGWIIGWGTWRARISMDRTYLTVVTYRGTRTVALRDVVDAQSGYYGLTVGLADESTITSSLGETTNVTRWRGKVSRADMKAALILGRAAEARGEVGFPRTLVGRRGTGNLSGGLWGAIGALLGSR